MIRVIVRETSYGDAVNVGGPVQTGYKSFELSAVAEGEFARRQIEKLELFLRQPPPYVSREVAGVELP